MALTEVDMFSNQIPTVEKIGKRANTKRGRVQNKKPSDRKKNENMRRAEMKGRRKVDTKQKIRGAKMSIRTRLLYQNN